MAERKRIQWIDVAKGICMLSVIAGHMGVDWINKLVFPYHLTVFFALSGYTLKNNLGVETLRKRFNGLMVPYFLTCAAVTAMDVFNQLVIKKQADLVSVTYIFAFDLLRSFMASGSETTFGSIEIGGRIGAVWFLPATFFAVAAAQILLKYVTDRKFQWAFAIGASVLANISARFIWLPFSIQSGFFALPLILLGYYAHQYNVLDNLSLRHFLLALAVFTVGLVTGKASIYYVTATMGDLLLSTLFGLSSSICVIYIAKKMENCRPIAWIGKNSIYFLCLHLFELETMGHWFWKCFELTGIQQNKLLLFFVKIIFISTITFIIVSLRKYAGGVMVEKP